VVKVVVTVGRGEEVVAQMTIMVIVIFENIEKEGKSVLQMVLVVMRTIHGYYSRSINNDEDDDAVTVVVADRGAEVEAVQEVDGVVVDHRPNKGDVLIAALPGIVIRVASIRESIIVVEIIVARRGIAIVAEAVVDVGLIDRVVSIAVVEEEVVEAEDAIAAEVTDLSRMYLQIIIGVVGATVPLLDLILMAVVVVVVAVAAVVDNLNHRPIKMHDDPNHVPTSAIVVSSMILALTIETTATENVGMVVEVQGAVSTKATLLEIKEVEEAEVMLGEVM
jgi:hypothetical protein